MNQTFYRVLEKLWKKFFILSSGIVRSDLRLDGEDTVYVNLPHLEKISGTGHTKQMKTEHLYKVLLGNAANVYVERTERALDGNYICSHWHRFL